MYVLKEDIRANRLARLEREAGSKTPVISGHTSDGTYNQLDLLNASSRTSKVTSRLDSTASSATWKKMVTTQRGDYSQRLKSVRHTSGSESSYLPTPTAAPYGTSQNGQRPDGSTFKQAGKPSLESMARHNLWPTPRASEYKDCGPVGSKSHTHMDKRSYLCAKAKDPDQPSGLLNPTWVEWLMGVPTGWTELGSWGTE